MRFLLDEDLSPEVAVIARNLGLDVTSVHEEGRQGLSDEEQLSHAASERRILVTRNRDDFIELTRQAYQAGTPHPGVLIVVRSLPNRRSRALAEALVRWHESRSDVPFAGCLEFLSGGR